MKFRSMQFRLIKIYYVLVFICSITTIQAQNFDDDVVDNPAPAAPIDNWLVPMFVIGVVLVYYIYRRQSTVTPR